MSPKCPSRRVGGSLEALWLRNFYQSEAALIGCRARSREDVAKFGVAPVSRSEIIDPEGVGALTIRAAAAFICPACACSQSIIRGALYPRTKAILSAW